MARAERGRGWSGAVAAGERSEFAAIAERSPRARSARACSALDGILGFPGIPFPSQKSHSYMEAGVRPFRARWDFGISENPIPIPKSQSVPISPNQSHTRTIPDHAAAGGRPFSDLASVLRHFSISASAFSGQRNGSGREAKALTSSTVYPRMWRAQISA